MRGRLAQTLTPNVRPVAAIPRGQNLGNQTSWPIEESSRDNAPSLRHSLRPTTVGPACSISWNKTNDPKVTRYELTVINQENPAEKTVLIIPADTTKLPCKDAGADHERLWGVTVQFCDDTFTCSVPPGIVRMRIASEYVRPAGSPRLRSLSVFSSRNVYPLRS